MQEIIMFGNSAMSYNMIDFTIFEKMDCNAEAHYHKTFATYHKYAIQNINFLDDKWEILFCLEHEQQEANNPKYAEIVIHKDVKISYNNLYNSKKIDKFYKGLDAVLGSYYIVELIHNEIILTSKNKGKIPNIITPTILIKSCKGIEFDIKTLQYGKDTDVFVPNHKKNVIHIPHTTKGKNYQLPKIGDRLYIIDSIDNEQDRTFTREITKITDNASCTCDVIELDLPIDRLEQSHIRNDGLALLKPRYNINNYTANFNKVQLWKRREDFKEYILNRNQSTGICTKQIGNYANMKEISTKIVNDYISKNRFKYYGATIHWQEYKNDLQHIYNDFGNYLCEHLFLLKSSKDRPDYLVHIDYHHEHPEIPVTASLTWPVLNCTDETLTVWYDAFLNDESIFELGKQNVTITNDEIRLVEKDRYSFNTKTWNSVILNHENWHTVYNNSDDTNERMLLQWRFKPGITWEEILDLTKKIHC